MILLYTIVALAAYLETTPVESVKRSFTVNWAGNQFLKDGQPFHYVAGSIHYYQVPFQMWRDRLRKMRYSGVNTLQTYVEWNSHEPKPTLYDFKDQNDLIQFIKIAQEEDLFVVLRPGPFIDSEREMGGLPSWLLKEKNIKLRSRDPKYLIPVDRWLKHLLPMIKPLLYKNGGPILMVQIENEYGSYSACDRPYTEHLRDLTHQILGNDTVLFTTDGDAEFFLKCGPVPKVLATIDFGTEARNVSQTFEVLRPHQPHGPKVNSEFYVGWLDRWSFAHSKVPILPILNSMEQMLKLNASFSIYMFHGGTNFGFRGGGVNNSVPYFPCTTSYDFDAPLSEAGDMTWKYTAIRQLLLKYLPAKEGLKVANSTKIEIPSITMVHAATLFDVLPPVLTISEHPLTFEELDHNYGFMLYTTNLTSAKISKLSARVYDRAHVFVDKTFQGILSRIKNEFDLKIQTQQNTQLSILVENLGRASIGDIQDHRGIVSRVTLDQDELHHWQHYRLFDHWDQLLTNITDESFIKKHHRSSWPGIPSFYVANFTLPQGQLGDSFLRVDGWKHGVVFLNGHNLGRYWPTVGPQITLYVPSVYFRPNPQTNQIVLFELDGSQCHQNDKCQIKLVKEPVLDGPVAGQGRVEFF